jgi:hypothetical protein
MRKLMSALSALCIVVFMVGALPTLELVERHTANVQVQSVGAAKAATTPLPPRIALQVRVGDAALADALRAVVTGELAARGVEPVENSVTWPRVELTVESWQGRWTPFHATAQVRARARLHDKARSEVVDEQFEVTAALSGLVSKRAWQQAVVDKLGSYAVERVHFQR